MILIIILMMMVIIIPNVVVSHHACAHVGVCLQFLVRYMREQQFETYSGPQQATYKQIAAYILEASPTACHRALAQIIHS
jgi:competence protein ComGC